MHDEESQTPDGLSTSLLVIAVGVIAISLLSDLLPSGTRDGFGTGQVLLLVGGLVIGAIGLAMRFGGWLSWILPVQRSLTSLYRLAAFSVFNLILLIGGFETAGWLIDRQATSSTLSATTSPFYASQPWSQTHWQEFEQLEDRFVYTPYTAWRTAEFPGQTIGVDSHGIRRTLPVVSTNPTSNPEVVTVFAFGGSAMWGHGAPDDGTIPAYLQGELQQKWQRPVQVVNFGERGHVVTQSLIRLMVELQAGRIPDHVVFYHGFNEVVGALKGEVGAHLAAREVALRLESPFRTWLSETRVLAMLRRNSPLEMDSIRSLEPIERSRIASSVVDNYLGAHQLLRAWAATYRFTTSSFWQPVQGTLDQGSLQSRELGALIDAAADDFERRCVNVDRLGSLADTIDQGDPLLWADQVHLTPLGNQQIAKIIAEKMPRQAVQKPQDPS